MTVLAEPRQTVAAPAKLINLIIKRLLPMLLDATDGDAQAARALAKETINDYAARNNADLIAIAQIIACGLASLGNLSLSMAGDLPHALVLRLQAAANALERTAEQNRRFLRQTPPPQSDIWYEPVPDDATLEAEAIAAVAEAQQHIAQTRAAQAVTPAPEPTHPAPSEPAPGKTAPDLTEQQKAVIWAQAMKRVAAEYTASIPHLPPAQRREASLRAAALNSTANALIAGVPPDPFLLPKTPKTPKTS